MGLINYHHSSLLLRIVVEICFAVLKKYTNRCLTFAFSLQKRTPPWKKYTTAGAGGVGLYELCLGLDYLVDIIL